MKKKRTSIKDIAKKLNVSVTTVSFVLNGKAKEKRISDRLTKQILEYIKKIDYKPNVLAQSLRTGESRLIVVMVEDIYSKIARILEDLAHVKGYKILFCSNDNNDEKALGLINLFLERQVDGFIIAPSPGLGNKLKLLNDEKIPVVLFDRYFPDINTSYVIVDNEDAIYRATSHLFSNGFKNIAFITIGYSQTQMKDRLKGYEKAIKKHAITSNILELPSQQKYEERKIAIERYLNENRAIDGICFATNYLGKIGLEVVKKNFPKFFENKGMVTFDDDLIFELFEPSITAIEQSINEIGEKLIDILLRQIKEGVDKSPVENIIIKTKMNIRNSSVKKTYKML